MRPLARALNRQKYWLVAATILWLLLAACRANPPVAVLVEDDSFITQIPCAPPCWQGLTPGVATASDVRSFVASSPLINGNFGDVFDDPSSPSFSQSWWWAGQKQRPETENSFQVDDQGYLTSTYLYFNSEITVAQMFSVYGAPTIVAMGLQPGGDMFALGRPSGVGASALYLDQGFIVSWFEEMDWRGLPVRFCPQADHILSHIQYIRSDLMADVADDWYFRARDGAVYTSGNSVMSLNNGQLKLNCFDIP